MKHLIALIAAAGLTLSACNKSEDQNAKKSEATPATATSTTATTPAPAPAPKPADATTAAPVTAPPGVTTGAGDAAPVVDVEKDPRRATAQGTLEMFVETMKAADYESTLDLVDPSSDGYSQIQEALNAMINIKDKKDGAVSIEDLYRTLFTKAWQHASLKKVGEQEGHFQYVISFEKSDPVTIDVRNATGSWLVIAPTNIFVLEQAEEAPAPPAATPPAAPPASSTPPPPAPAPQGGH